MNTSDSSIWGFPDNHEYRRIEMPEILHRPSGKDTKQRNQSQPGKIHLLIFPSIMSSRPIPPSNPQPLSLAGKAAQHSLQHSRKWF